MVIRDICRDKRNALGMTNVDIARVTKIPLSTVNNFFSSASKAPSIYTVGPICAALGISLDAYFAIGDHLTNSEETLQIRVDEMAQHLETKQRIIKLMTKGLRIRNVVIILLLLIVLMLLVWAAYVDLNSPDVGLFRGHI